MVIAGLQDGLWPNTTPRGGVLGTQRLLDVLGRLVDAGMSGVDATRRVCVRSSVATHVTVDVSGWSASLT